MSTIYYHATPYVIETGMLYPNEQGLHLTYTNNASMDVMKDRFLDKRDYDIYQVELPFELHPLRFDFDMAYWSASEIATALLIKMGENNQPKTLFDEMLVMPEMIHIDNLYDGDRSLLHYYEYCNNNYEDFYEIMDFLSTKGFNSLEYPLIESGSSEYSVVINCPVKAYSNTNNSNKYWKYANEMIDAYNKRYKL